MIMIIIIVNPPLFRRILQAVDFSHLEYKVFVGRVTFDQFPAEEQNAPVPRVPVHGKLPAPMGILMGQIVWQNQQIWNHAEQGKDQCNKVFP